jgi:hypothetical protein
MKKTKSPKQGYREVGDTPVSRAQWLLCFCALDPSDLVGTMSKRWQNDWLKLIPGTERHIFQSPHFQSVQRRINHKLKELTGQKCEKWSLKEAVETTLQFRGGIFTADERRRYGEDHPANKPVAFAAKMLIAVCDRLRFCARCQALFVRTGRKIYCGVTCKGNRATAAYRQRLKAKDR